LKDVASDQLAKEQVELSELPEGWKWIRMGEIIASMKNGLYKPAKYYGEGIPSLRMYNIHEGNITLDNVRRVRLSSDEIEDYSLVAGDILLNRINSRELVGKAAVIPQGIGTIIFEAMNIRIRVRRETVEPKYLTYYLLTSEARRRIELKVKQTVGMGTVDQSDIASWPLPLAPIMEQVQIVKRLDFILSYVDQLARNTKQVSDKIDQLQQSILTKAFQGELIPQDPNGHNRSS
ncbi:MAG: restriction endonuclease subunit S, partial [Nitrososphaerales archaeon]